MIDMGINNHNKLQVQLQHQRHLCDSGVLTANSIQKFPANCAKHLSF